MSRRLPTVGIGVSDLDASVRFYADALGLHVAPNGGTLEGTVILTDDRHVRLALEQRRDRTPPVGMIPTIANLGLVNLTFYAPMLDPVLARIEQAGGHVLAETRVMLDPDREGIFAADPDGVPIELISAGDMLAFIHVVICVTDLERSAPIIETLGYSPARDIDLSQPRPPVSQFTRLPDVRLRGRVFRHPAGGEIELIEMLHPKPAGSAGTGAVEDAPGLRHIAIQVDDLDTAIAALEMIGANGVRAIDLATGRAAWHGMDLDSTRLWCFASD
jgi:catechol 2,3-dioxygenase-like lactoylglutathione lyase family enzyme